jgi:hypothetical protein
MTKSSRNWLLGIGTVVLLVWLTKYFSEAEMRRLDKEVDRLCAIDGGVRIYETVRLPASKFHELGQPLVPQGGKDDTGFGYYKRLQTITLEGPGQAPGAQLIRNQSQVIRTGDGKVIAEVVWYTRSGGYWLEGLPGVGHGRNCPGPYPADFERRVFIKE